MKQERYAGVLVKVERRINEQLRILSAWLQHKTNALPAKIRLIAFMVIVIFATMMCVGIVYNALK